MKRTVHNERWKAVHDKHIEAWDLVLDDQDEMNFAHRGSFLTLDDPGYDEARARLAAQAPAMARLLLSLEWGADVCIGYDNMTARGCSSCGGLEKQPAPGRADFDGFTVGHAPDCALVAVLKAAGVIE